MELHAGFGYGGGGGGCAGEGKNIWLFFDFWSQPFTSGEETFSQRCVLTTCGFWSVVFVVLVEVAECTVVTSHKFNQQDTEEQTSQLSVFLAQSSNLTDGFN